MHLTTLLCCLAGMSSTQKALPIEVVLPREEIDEPSCQAAALTLNFLVQFISMTSVLNFISPKGLNLISSTRKM